MSPVAFSTTLWVTWKDRQADRDGDAELKAYNERLAALAKKDAEE